MWVLSMFSVAPVQLLCSSETMRHSDKCTNLEERWDQLSFKCIPCTLRPGYEVTPNCGYDDDGGRHDAPFEPCKPQTFNDGSTAYCRACSLCPIGYRVELLCNSTADTKCAEIRLQRTEVLENQTHPATTPSHIVHHSGVTGDATLWAVPLTILLVVLVMLTAFIYYMRQKKRGWDTALRFSRRSSYINAGFSSISATPANIDQEDFPSPDVLSAPLQVVLDNLDVLEELVILLDPEIHGVKNTKHLASLLSFPATWINYTYSMKSSKSPLKTVLEGVNSRYPDWTVRHLVELLQQIERNDAIAVLSKIRLSDMAV